MMNTSINFRDFLLGSIRKAVAAAGLSAILLLAFGFGLAEAYPPGDHVYLEGGKTVRLAGPGDASNTVLYPKYMTIEAWIQVRSWENRHSIVRISEGVGEGWRIFVDNTDKKLKFGHSGKDDTTQYLRGEALNLGQWYHIAVVFRLANPPTEAWIYISMAERSPTEISKAAMTMRPKGRSLSEAM